MIDPHDDVQPPDATAKTSLRAGSAVRIEAPPLRDVRRGADAVRLAVSGAGLAVAWSLAVVTRPFARQVQQGLLSAAVALPASLRDVLVVAVQAAALLGPLAAMVVLVAQHRLKAIRRILPAAVLGAVLAWSLTHALPADSRPDLWPRVLVERDGLLQAGWPPPAYLAACAAAVVAAGPWLSRRWRRVLWTLTAGCGGLSVAAAVMLPLDAIAALAVGGVAGSAVLLLAAAPADRPPPQAVADALLSCGIPVAWLREPPPGEQQPGEGIVYQARTVNDEHLAVRVLAREDRDRDQFRRLSRQVLLRHPADAGSPQTPLAAVEHELLMLVFAARAGAHVTEPVIAYPVAGGGALLVTVGTAPSTLSELADEEITAALLTGMWASVARLQERRLAHRALRPDHILVEPDGQCRLSGFARAQLNATPEMLGIDIAELLATTAARFGAHRATECARAGLGTEALATALPYLQPLALLGPARRTVARYDRTRTAQQDGARRTLRPGGRPSLLRDLATEVCAATGTKPAPPAPLARFTWKTAFGLISAFAVLHLMLPQLADAGSAIDALRSANWWWVLAALPVTFLSQAFSTFLQQGTIPGRLPFPATYQVQLAASFLNRITPSNTGGMVLSLRYLQKTGINTAAATASVGLQSLAGMAANIVLAAVFFSWSGRPSGSLHLHLPAGRYTLPIIVFTLAAGGLLGFTPHGRQFLRDKVWQFLRQAFTALTMTASDPAKLALTIIGALGLPLVQITGLALCLQAFGGGLPFKHLGALYIAVRLIANAAPVAGGLGAVEAGLIAGLTALGVQPGPAASTVLVYRLLSYWLNIPLGAAALADTQRRGYV